MLSRTLLLLVAVLGFTAPITAAEPTIEFNRDVRPILSDTCFACHGPDSRARKADLRLDSKEAFSDKSIVMPGQSAKSALFQRLTSSDPAEVMPPPKGEKKLTAKQIEIIKKWIDQGAKYEGHWAFEPIERPKPPAVQSAQHPIDAFILAELTKQKLKSSSVADKVTLIRRLSFDLTGLPPKPEDVDLFLKDNSPKAYEKLVDKYLASPHYGERMAMFWLDLVRYADSVGYHGDQPVGVSPYRDWVIKAFNDNMRFNQFTLEQIAGDLVPNATIDQQIASGYNRLGMMSAEGGVQPKEYLAKYAAERVRNLGGTWLGITLGCCECHDHKFDPFTMKDFYRLEAFFADIKEKGIYDGGNFGPDMPVPTAEQRVQILKLDARIAELKKLLETSTPELENAQISWEKSLPKATQWQVLKPLTAKSAAGSKLTPQADGAVLAAGKNPVTDTYTLTAKLPAGKYTAIRVEALPHDSLPTKGPGRAGNGNFVLTELLVSISKKDGTPEKVKLQNATETFAQSLYVGDNPYKKFFAAAAIDGDVKGKKWGWAIAGETGKAQHAVFETATDLIVDENTSITVEMQQNLDNPNHVLGHFRLAMSTSPRPVVADGAGTAPEIRAIIAIESSKRTAEQKQTLSAYYRTIAPTLAATRTELANVEKQKGDTLKTAPSMLITQQVPPRTIRVLPRGNWMDDSGPIVEPGYPEALPKPAARKERLTRLDLAKWIIAPENPLPARALANRMWKIYFGAGLSRKIDDMGSQGEWPTHPELIDFLASQIIESGWDIKALVKLIVTSQTYQQTSVATQEHQDLDPYNRWLARQSRFRLDAELVRDNALAVSGLLVDKIGGPSVKPYQPPGYWAYLNFPMREWQTDAGEKTYRRGLYTHWQRQYLHPSLMAFDAPSREECTADRVRSNTPLQALVLLNDPIYVEAARSFAERALVAGKTHHERFDWMYRQALSRAAKPAERDVLQALLTKHRGEYQAEPKAAEALLKSSSRAIPPNTTPAELAAWTSIARTVLNLHAVITRN